MASRLFEVRDLLRMHRIKNVSAQLEADFDLTSLPVRLQEVAGTHKSVRAVKDLGVAQLWFQLQHDDSFAIGAVRHLDEHWQELKPLIEAEDLELSIAAVEVPTVAKPKAAVLGDQLGTLVSSAAQVRPFMPKLRKRFMCAIRAKAAERYEQSRRQRLARVRWLTGVLKLWDSDKHRTLGKFLQTRAGRVFRRRCSSVLSAR